MHFIAKHYGDKFYLYIVLIMFSREILLWDLGFISYGGGRVSLRELIPRLVLIRPYE